MKTRWDEALRSLARRPQGPFRVLAYGVTGTPDQLSVRSADLLRALVSEGFQPPSKVVVEVARPTSGASGRPRFREDVLDWIDRPQASGAPEQTPSAGTRERLRTVSSGLAELLGALSSDLPADTAMVHPAEPELPFSPTETPLVLVERFEDLGAEAEAIGAAIQEVLCHGAHLLLPAEGIDTRTRDGRGRAALVMRLADIKAAASRERSLRELEERRSGLEVYGPVPFGFERSGRKLVPVVRSLETVGRAKELAGRGLSRFEIAHALNREGRPWKDGSSWTGRRVELVLRNPIYDRAGREEIA
jgi:hypothetical protein